MIPAVDLNLMLVLHTVLAERNVARAAARLHVTPSAVSNALARLRDLLGDPLVTRQGRGVVPTPRAAEIAPGIARAIQEIERALLSAPFDAASCTRAFTLAVADLGQIAWVPRLANAMRREMPLAQLRIIGIDALLSLGDLGSSEVDLHVGIPAKGPGIHVAALFEEKTALVARRGHPLAARRLSRRALADLRHVRVEMVPGRNLKDPFAALFARSGAPRQVAVTVPSFTTAAEVVAQSDLVTMMPSSFVAAKGEALGLCTLASPLAPHAIPLAMCWHERTHADAAARAFRTLVRAVIGEVLGPTPPGSPARRASSRARASTS
jgi:DNA-binding transcriptional LysR family regulator